MKRDETYMDVLTDRSRLQEKVENLEGYITELTKNKQEYIRQIKNFKKDLRLIKDKLRVTENRYNALQDDYLFSKDLVKMREQEIVELKTQGLKH